MHTRYLALTLAMAVLIPALLQAQTTSPGPGIDVEIVNPVDGSNNFCAQIGQPFWAEVWVRPGDDTTSCSLGCGTVAGGTGKIAAAAVDIGFDPLELSMSTAETNPDPSSAAVDGLVMNGNVLSGRVGWSLAGDWVVDGDPSSGLEGPCTQTLLDSPGWVFRIQLTATASGSGLVSLSRQPEFALSFADHCGAGAFTPASGDLDELVPGFVTTACSDQADIVFADSLETGSTGRWSSVHP